jgi:iron-sulfur cluster assembly protein
MKSLPFLDGSTLDYKEEGLMQRGFTFLNPNSSGTCGCGESFAV